MWLARRYVGRDVTSVEIRILRQVNVRRAALLDYRTDSVREADVGPIPGATISRDGAISRVWLRRRVAALDQLRELPCRQCDVRAWCEHDGRHRPRIDRKPRQSDADAITLWACRLRLADSDLERWQYARQALAWH